MDKLSRIYIGLAAAMLATAGAGAAELYKWVDENGTTNYSNNPPPKSRAKVTTVEDRVSFYTPEKSVTDAVEQAKNKPPAPKPSATLPVAKYAPPPPPPPPTAYDPCMTPGDPNCQIIVYDNSPVFQRRRVAPPHDPRHPPIASGTVISPRGQGTGEWPSSQRPGEWPSSLRPTPPRVPAGQTNSGIGERDRR